MEVQVGAGFDRRRRAGRATIARPRPRPAADARGADGAAGVRLASTIAEDAAGSRLRPARARRSSQRVQATSSPEGERTVGSRLGGRSMAAEARPLPSHPWCSSRPIRCSPSTIPVGAIRSGRPGSTRSSRDSTSSAWARTTAPICGRRPATRAELERVHPATYLDALERLCADRRWRARRRHLRERALVRRRDLRGGRGARRDRSPRRRRCPTARSSRCARPATTRCRPTGWVSAF